ncbi:poly(A)-binding protein binding protein [Elasticomyces elasticus]|nr:poly(A)-binding protein binding protein [Elasticomyces elasticus]
MSTPTAATNGSEGGAAKKGQQQQRAGAAGKALDGQRKGNNGSPAATAAGGEGGRKQKAWSGTNPTILPQQPQPQRSATPNGAEKPLPKLPSQAQQQQQNNNNNTKQHQQQPQPQPEVNGIPDKHAHDRLLYVLGNCVGLDATVGLKSGEQFTGVFTGFYSSTNHNNGGKYILSMVRRTHVASPHQQNNENAQTNGHATPTAESSSAEEFVGEGEDHTMAFDVQDTTCLSVDDVIVSAPPTGPQQNGSVIPTAAGSTGFMTDTQISSSRAQPGQQRARELQRWDAGQDTDVDLSLESSAGVGGMGAGEWDQFATNESKFGVGSTYKEEYYTTSIDRSDPGYRRREQEAERIAREMEGDASSNTNNKNGGRGGREEGLDEEDRYSGVRREGLDTKVGGVGGGSARESAGLLPKRKEGAYVPPRERPITGGPAPGVNRAPWDPAILSTSKPAPKEVGQQGGGTPTILEPALSTPAQPTPAAQPTPSAATTPRTTATSTQPVSTAESSTQDHISKTIDAFKLFASNEKLKVRQQQELKRAGARQEKNVKLNDLKKFAANFKLNSRVPDDLVPILAKDREKQLLIQRAAEAAAKEAELSPKKVGRGSPKEGVKEGGVKEGGGKVEGGNGKAGMGGEVSRGEKLRGAQVLQQQIRTAQGGSAQSPRSPAFPQQSRNGGSGPHQGFGRGGGAAGQAQGMPVQQQQQQAHPSQAFSSSQAPLSSQAPPPPQLPAVRIPDGPAGWQGGAGAPLSPASRFNINAMEFRPIAANLAGTTPSPKRKGSASATTAVVAEPAQQKISKISSDSFFGKGGKPIEEQDRKDADEEYDPVKRMLAQKDFASEVEKKAVMGNGGVVQPFKTGPTWPGKEGESFLAGFQRQQVLVEQPAMQVPPHQSHLPPPHHVQGPPQQGMVGTPSQRHQQYFAGGGGNTPQHGGFADPRMMGQQFGGSVQSSPRFQSAQMAGFGGQIPPHMQQQGGPQMPGPQYGGGGGQGYGMSPSMQQRQMMPPQQQQQQGMMMPQQYGQANGRFQGRRGSKGGQQQQQQQWGGGPDERGQRGGFPAAHFGGQGGVPMMQTLSQQGHGGQFMNGPPPANMGGGYSPMPHQAQMQGGYSGSPGRPTMMAHSGSHQGFNPQQQQQMHGMHGGPPPPQGPGMQQQQGQPFAMGPGGAHPMHWQQQQRQMSGGYGGGPSPQHSGGMTPRSQQAMPMLQQGGGGGHSGLNSPAAVGMGQGGEEVKGG